MRADFRLSACGGAANSAEPLSVVTAHGAQSSCALERPRGRFRGPGRGGQRNHRPNPREGPPLKQFGTHLEKSVSFRTHAQITVGMTPRGLQIHDWLSARVRLLIKSAPFALRLFLCPPPWFGPNKSLPSSPRAVPWRRSPPPTRRRRQIENRLQKENE